MYPSRENKDKDEMHIRNCANNHTVALQGAMPSPSLFSIIAAIPVHYFCHSNLTRCCQIVLSSKFYNRMLCYLVGDLYS
jgi:hypothetical protein